MNITDNMSEKFVVGVERHVKEVHAYNTFTRTEKVSEAVEKHFFDELEDAMNAYKDTKYRELKASVDATNPLRIEGLVWLEARDDSGNAMILDCEDI